ncbi:MAG: hypothetical protein AAF687_05695 [Pseudomonadota bacterium]
MRELILGVVLVPTIAAGVFFFSTGEPQKTYPMTVQEATRTIDDAVFMLKQVRYNRWRPYSYPAGSGVVEFINRGSGTDAVCIAEVESAGDDGVTVDVSCPGAKDTSDIASYKEEVAKISLREFVDAALTGRQMDQANVDAEFAKLDLSGLGQDDLAVLKAQSQIAAKRPSKGEANRRAAREQYAEHFNSQGEGGDAGWSADGAFNAIDD